MLLTDQVVRSSAGLGHVILPVYPTCDTIGFGCFRTAHWITAHYSSFSSASPQEALAPFEKETFSYF